MAGMPFDFVDPAVEAMRLRMSIAGTSGGGKTYGALAVARALVGESGTVAGIDSERGSMKIYHAPRGPFRFKHLELPDHKLATYTRAIELAAKHRFDALVVDSMTHAWYAALNQVGKGGKQGWGDIRGPEQAFWNALLTFPGHVIACFRVKSRYVETETKDGRPQTKKQGLEAIQREFTEYEFDIVLRVDHMGETVEVEKTRCDLLADKQLRRLGPDFVDLIRPWLDAGVRSDESPAVLTQPEARARSLLKLCPPAWHAAICGDIDETGGDLDALRAVCGKIESAMRDARIKVPPIDPAHTAPVTAKAEPEAAKATPPGGEMADDTLAMAEAAAVREAGDGDGEPGEAG